MRKVLLLLLVFILLGGAGYYFLGMRKIVSPLPQQPDIKVIFPDKAKVSPTMVDNEATPTAKEEESVPTKKPVLQRPTEVLDVVTPAVKSVSPTKESSASGN